MIHACSIKQICTVKISFCRVQDYNESLISHAGEMLIIIVCVLKNTFRVHCLSPFLSEIWQICWLVIWFDFFPVLHAIIFFGVWECGTVRTSRICQQQCMYLCTKESLWVWRVFSMPVHVVCAWLNLYSHDQQQPCMPVVTTDVYAASP